MKHTMLMTGTSIELPTPNWKLFENMLSSMKIVDHKGKELMNPLDVCKSIFEQTFYHYSLKYMEEKEIRTKYESKIIEKNVEIGKLQQEIKELKEKYEVKKDA